MTSSFLRFLYHTQRRITVDRSPLDDWSARRRDLYPTTQNTHNRQTFMPPWDNMIKYKQNIVKHNSLILLRIHLNKIISWVAFDCILLIFWNSIQHNRAVSPASYLYHLLEHSRTLHFLHTVYLSISMLFRTDPYSGYCPQQYLTHWSSSWRPYSRSLRGRNWLFI